MAEDTDVAVSLLLVRGGASHGDATEMDYLIQGREVDKSDLLPQRPDLFQPGEYPFYWPGAIALFGGHMEKGETPAQALAREMGEELPRLGLTPTSIENQMAFRTYNWAEDVPRILEAAEEVFQGNVGSFLGFDLNSSIPSCALGKDRKTMDGITYGEWMNNRDPDHYFAMNIGPLSKGDGLTDREGLGALWLPHWGARSMYTVPVDKIALLDDMTQRIKSGELEIRKV